MALGSLRARMPLVAFLLLAVLCLALFGFACACLAGHPLEAVESALSAMAALPAVSVVWSAALAFLAATGFAARRLSHAPTAAQLQRFLL